MGGWEVMEVNKFGGCLNHEWREFYEWNEGFLKGSGEKGQGSDGGESIWLVFEPRMARILRIE